MAGRGAAPKPADQRARRNKDPHPTTVVELTAVPQPKLPPAPEWLGPWPAATKRWWKAWGDSPLSAGFTELEWLYLAETALLHARAWGAGDAKAFVELRLRVAKFGVTAEDRLRLRMTAADGPSAGGATAARPAGDGDVHEQYAGLTLLPGAV